jgi:hypothetical protein
MAAGEPASGDTWLHAVGHPRDLPSVNCCSSSWHHAGAHQGSEPHRPSRTPGEQGAAVAELVVGAGPTRQLRRQRAESVRRGRWGGPGSRPTRPSHSDVSGACEPTPAASPPRDAHDSSTSSCTTLPPQCRCAECGADMNRGSPPLRPMKDRIELFQRRNRMRIAALVVIATVDYTVAVLIGRDRGRHRDRARHPLFRALFRPMPTRRVRRQGRVFTPWEARSIERTRPTAPTHGRTTS